MRVAKLRGPGAVRQEPGAGALINELIKDALKELGQMAGAAVGNLLQRGHLSRLQR